MRDRSDGVHYPTTSTSTFARVAVVSCVCLLGLLCATGCGKSAGPARGPSGARTDVSAMQLTSPAIPTAAEGSSARMLSAKYATRSVVGGQNLSIPYEWRDAPITARSFALLLVDRAPVAHDWVHWAVVNIPASATGLPEGASESAGMPMGATELDNTFGRPGYAGPQPPPGTGAHPYAATLFALDVDRVDAPPSVTAAELEKLLAPHVLAQATCTGYFGR